MSINILKHIRGENKMTESKLYNSEIKEKFLSRIENPASRKIAEAPLKKAAEAEEDLKKDLYEMDLEEIEDIMYNLTPSTETAAYGQAVRIDNYITWAAKNGYRKSNITPFDGVDKVEWSKKFVADYMKVSFTRQQILDMCDELYNEADKAILLAIFEGIGGTGFHELLNLRVEDIEEIEGQYSVTLQNKDKDKEPRVIPISKILADTLKRADGEAEYISGNGVDVSRYAPSSRYGKSPYIFKKMNRGIQGGTLNASFLSRKFDFFKGVFGLKYLKAKNIENSGMMHMAHEIYEKNKELTQEDIHSIGDRYDTTIINQDGKSYRNASVIRKILETPEFEEMYGYSIND